MSIIAGFAGIVALASAAGAPAVAPKDSDASIVLVRHALKECSGMQCDLKKKGHEQAARLGKITATLRAAGMTLGGVYSSSACRTVLTVTPAADEAGLPVNEYEPRDGLGYCAFPGPGDLAESRPSEAMRPKAGVTEGEGLSASRDALIAVIKAKAENAPDGDFALVADHSNYVCDWFRALGVDPNSYANECVTKDGWLAETDYGDIYWLYDAKKGEGADWRLIVLEDAFGFDQ
ncbi:MAG: histidine phosphatase family protein [Parvularculaceae bacterium]